MTLKEPHQAIKPDPVRSPAAAASKNRRRPDRSDQVSPNLIPLLRSSPMAETAPAVSDGEDMEPIGDALAPAQGIAVGLALSVPLWAAIGGIVWAML